MANGMYEGRIDTRPVQPKTNSDMYLLVYYTSGGCTVFSPAPDRRFHLDTPCGVCVTGDNPYTGVHQTITVIPWHRVNGAHLVVKEDPLIQSLDMAPGLSHYLSNSYLTKHDVDLASKTD